MYKALIVMILTLLVVPVLYSIFFRVSFAGQTHTTRPQLG